MQLSLFKSLQFRLPSLILLGTIPITILAIALTSASASKIIHQNTQDNLALQAQALNRKVSQDSLAVLTKQVGKHRFGQTGYSFIVDERGRLIEHSDPNLISGDEFKDYSTYPPVANLLAGEQSYFSFSDREGIKWVSYGTRLDNGWGIFVLQQRSEAFGSAREFKQLVFLVAIIATFALSILVWSIANRFTQPIESIITSAENLAKGDFDRTIELEREDEIGILAQSLNSIARSLQDYSNSSQEHQLELDRALEQQHISEGEQKLARAKLEQQVRELETKLTLVNKGDLTTKATITDDEIGRLAASYNSMVDNLRRIIDRVKTATQTVAFTTNSSENAISALSQGTLKQTADIDNILAKIQTMSSSMQNIAVNAEQAETIIKQASTKIKAGDAAINQTVDKIVALGKTTTETKEQAKRLGKASRKIAKAVELIRKIALQTNVLAVNTSIEAARAGEEGLGFNVVADEVQSLAAQSAQTATEIEKLVLEMQAETSKVIQAMEESNDRVIAGSKQVEETRFALKQITTASQEIDKLVEGITNVVGEQSETSQVITATMQEVAAIAQNNSTSVNYVADSFKELLSLALELQTSIGQFKVN